MSKLQVDDIVNKDDTGSVGFSRGAVVTGVMTATTFSGTVSSSTGSFSGDVDIADKIVHTGDTNTAIRFPAADTFSVETAGSEAIRVQSDGDVGIGTINNSNNERLRVQDDASTSTSCQLSIISGNAERAILNFGDKEDANIGRVTYDNSDNHLSLFTNNTEALRVDSSGRLLLGTTSSRSTAGTGADLQVETTDAGGRISVVQNRNDATACPFVVIGKSRGTSIGSNTVLQDDDRIGAIVFAGADGTDMGSDAARIIAEVDAAPGSNDMPGRLIFSTTADGSDSATERLRITSGGFVGVNCTPLAQFQVKTGTDANILMSTMSSEASIEMFNDAGNANVPFRLRASEQKFFIGGTERMRIDSSGNILIGGTPASSPNIRLNQAGTSSFNDQSTNGKFNIDSNGELQIGTTFDVSSTTAQGVYVSSGAVGGFGGVRVQSTNTATSVGQFFAAYRGSTLVFNVSTGGNLSCTGSFSKGSGSFKIDHPLKSETHHLVHSFVESPQADNIYRGKVDLVDGTAAVNIDTVAGMTDGTFVALNREIQCFTTNETGWTAIKGSVTGNVLTITAQENTCTDTISWLVIGERKDQHMYDTEWTDENGKVIVEPAK